MLDGEDVCWLACGFQMGVCMCVCVCVVQYGSGIGGCGVIFGTIPGFTPRTSVGVGMKCKGVFFYLR